MFCSPAVRGSQTPQLNPSMVRPEWSHAMRLLFVHDRFGAMAGAEVNLQLTATELKNRGHQVGLVHGPSTGKGELAWQELFSERFPLSDGDDFLTTDAALNTFEPDAIYLHKMPN